MKKLITWIPTMSNIKKAGFNPDVSMDKATFMKKLRIFLLSLAFIAVFLTIRSAIVLILGAV